MKPFVAIRTNACGGSGGAATLRDLSKALKNSGAGVAHVSERGNWSSQLAARRKPYGASNCDFSSDVMQWKYLYKSINRPAPRHQLAQTSPLGTLFRATADFIDFAENRLTGHKPQPMGAAVTVGFDLTQHKLFFPQAKAVLNHAGSPSTFIQWWSSKTPASSRAETYKRNLQQYSGVLFQAQVHALEAVALGAVEPGLAIVLRPACNESSVANAQRESSPFRSHRRSIVYVGSMQERKDQATAIRAFAQIVNTHKDVDLHLVGGSSRFGYLDELRALAAGLNVANRVRFWGHRGDSSRFIAHATIVLQTSRSEGVSRTLREAAFLGKPIVATSLSGTVELLSHEGGWLCDVGKHEEIGSALDAALTSGEAHERANCAQQRYRTSWSWNKYSADVAALAKRWQLLK